MTSAHLSSLGAVSATMAFRKSEKTGQASEKVLIPDSAQESRGCGDAEAEETEPVVATGTLPILRSSASPIRVLVVDDHEVVRRGICTLLEEENDFEIVGQASTTSDALALALHCQPDMVLLDVVLGPCNSLDIVQQLQRICPGIHVVIFTAMMDDETLMRALRLGVHGYLQKSLPLSDLLAALRSISQGERVISDPHAITQMLSEFSRMMKEQQRLRSGLSEIEIELVRQASEGRSNKEIAARQFWSEVTVKRKMQDIYRKLQVTDRAQAVAEVMRMGLI
jgi:DNA-binding NarL/FixJ family response regulator